MTVECFDCGHFHMRDTSGVLLNVAHVGLGRCSHETKVGHYVAGSYPRECRRFVACGQGDMRRAWVDAQTTLRIPPTRREA